MFGHVTETAIGLLEGIHMKRYARIAALATWCGFTALSLGCSPSDTPSAEETAIRLADHAWSKAMTDKQLDATVSHYAEDASIFPPNAPTATGKNAIRNVWAAYFAMPGFLVTCHPVKIAASHSGDIGYTQGPYALTFRDATGRKIKDRGRYIAVWKKQADGEWRVVADFFNSDLPKAPPPR
jgi:ketosteroid isomerase-like protein